MYLSSTQNGMVYPRCTSSRQNVASVTSDKLKEPLPPIGALVHFVKALVL